MASTTAIESEARFSTWLKGNKIRYERDVKVDGGDVDFLLTSISPSVYCDVKEIRDSANPSRMGLDADDHIRGDIRKLRRKFKAAPTLPVVLVSMNYSQKFFTGLTVARAMLGEVGITFIPHRAGIVKGTHHLPRGDASMTQAHNRSVSGVLIWTGENQRHSLFTNPFATVPVDGRLFPDTEVLELDRSAPPEAIHALSNRMFWPL